MAFQLPVFWEEREESMYLWIPRCQQKNQGVPLVSRFARWSGNHCHYCRCNAWNRSWFCHPGFSFPARCSALRRHYRRWLPWRDGSSKVIPPVSSMPLRLPGIDFSGW